MNKGERDMKISIKTKNSYKYFIFRISVLLTLLILTYTLGCGGGGDGDGDGDTNFIPSSGNWNGTDISFTVSDNSDLMNDLSIDYSGRANGILCSYNYNSNITLNSSITIADNKFQYSSSRYEINGEFIGQNSAEIDFSWSYYDYQCLVTVEGDSILYASYGNDEEEDNILIDVEFCGQVDNYVNGYGVEGVDEILVESIQGPEGATVSNQTNGEYIVTGTYKLGTYSSASISLNWGGTTSYSLTEDYPISSPGEGDFTVRVIKESGGSGNLFLRMSSGSKWMFDVVPVNTNCSSAISIEQTFNYDSLNEVFDYDENEEGLIIKEFNWKYVE
jgi:hypothetical protein